MSSVNTSLKFTLFSFAAAIYENAAEHVGAKKVVRNDSPNLPSSIIQESHRRYAGSIYYGPWFDFSSRTTTIVTPPPSAASPLIRSREDSKKKENEYTTAKWVGFLVSAAAALATGYFWSAFRETRKILKDTIDFESTKFKEFVDKYTSRSQRFLHDMRYDDLLNRLLNRDSCFYYHFESLLKRKLEIDWRNYSKARDYLFSSMILLAGGIATTAGGFLKHSKVMNVGYIGIALGVISSLFYLGIHWNDCKSNLEHYKHIVGFRKTDGTLEEGLATIIKDRCTLYDENMDLIELPSNSQRQGTNPSTCNLDHLIQDELGCYSLAPGADELPPPYREGRG